MKRCPKCQQKKETAAFHRDNTSRDGFSHSCKLCRRHYEKQRRLKVTQKQYTKRYYSQPEIKDRKSNNKYSSVSTYSKQLCRAARIRAKQKHIEFSIDADYIAALILIGVCPRTGFLFDMTRRKNEITNDLRSPFSPSIDRLDNTKGYTKDNVQVVCNWYNIAKNYMQDDFLLMLMRTTVWFNYTK